MLNNIFVFLNNACGSDCPADGLNHLCENCYKITRFCEECELHLKSVLYMSDGIWAFVILVAVLCAVIGYIFGYLERPIKNI